jgi:MoaA/NifB/PqqE/SkfB family radical SAM enzyme
MDPVFNLEEYLSNGVEEIVKGAVKASFRNPKESLFVAKFALAVKEARKIRQSFEKQGEHIPPFLIASITGSCNLHCAGCYARANKMCSEAEADAQLNSQEWNRIFEEAGELGINFILLAGGEPLLRMDVLMAAAAHRKILFPVFTNGTLLDEAYLKHFDKNRNLVPVLSIEGEQEYTDNRRGEGIYDKLCSVMEHMKSKGILFGTSITVTRENIRNITGPEFINDLYQKGCKVVFLVEYVPVNRDIMGIAPTEEDRSYLEEKLLILRKEYEDMIFISFPGDEKSSGGCLAAGRGFFHINPSGGSEPCPFSPYSDTNLKDTSLRKALGSPLFQKLSESQILMKEHEGGCVLFGQEDEVRKLLGRGPK